jgi:photosystem II protein PsbQ
MKKFQSILAIALALVAVVVFSFGSPAEAKRGKATTYSAEQLAEIQASAANLTAVRDRLPELAELIQKQDWVFVRNFIHGPLGELRATMSRVSRNLLPDAQKQALKLLRDVFDDLETIDVAAQNRDYKLAIRNYAETLRDFDAFLDLIPKA